MSPPAPSRSPLHGREYELAAVDDLLEAARASHSGCLVIRGDAGIGKSALLAEAATRAADMQVLRAVGVEAESELAFAALHQLVAPLLDRLDELPGPQALALAGALGIAPSTRHDRFLVGVAVLSLLAAAAEDRPVLCLLDDAHWLDDPSADALLFAARRLEAEPVVLLFAAREGEARRFDERGLPAIQLRGLGREAAAALLATAAGRRLSRTVSDRLIETTRGNPLALLELPQALSDQQRAGTEPVADPLPLTARVENVFLERVRRLPDDAQRLLLVAALDDTADASLVLAAAAALGIAAGSLEVAEDARLVRVVDGVLRFGHPLVRSAIYQSASFVQRQRAHEALVGVLIGDRYADRRAWHRAAATTGADAAVADELAESAERAKRRGGFGAAAAALERAALLTTDDATRAVRLFGAAQAAWLAGQPVRARSLLTQADELTNDELLHANASALRGAIEVQLGRPRDANTIFFRAATELAATYPARALELLAAGTEAAAIAGEQLNELRAALQLIDALPSEATSGRFEVALLRGIAMMLGGDYVAGAAELSTATERAEQSTDARITMSLGNRAIVTGRLADARKLYARATDQARAQSELPTLAWTLATLAGTEVFAGLVASAAANAEEGLALAGDTGQVNVRAYHLAVLACVAAFYGRDDECRTRAAEAFETIRANGLGLQGCLATWALTELELSRSRPMDACVHLDAYWGRGAGPVNRVLNYLLRPDHIEASVRAGRDEAAREALADFEAWTDGTESPHARPLVMRCRALLGTPDEAPALFERALRLHEADDHLFNRARTQLLYGEFLRRARARREARVHLRAAIELFDQFGAAAWAERGRAELRASGETARRRDPSTLDMLTPQELQIARFVTAGSTNKEVAAQLFLSPRTIDFHLRNVFTKLGIRSRHELHRFAFDGEPATSPVRA